MEQLIKEGRVLTNNSGEPIIKGCNYHTTWQSNKGMRFVLKGIRGNKANLITRNTKNDFWTDLDDLVFIKTGCNIRKAKRLLKQ